MKIVRLFIFLLLVGIPKAATAQTKPTITVDTILSCSFICLDTTISSFIACIILPGGIATETFCRGNMFFYSAGMKPGTVIIIDKISARSSAGRTVKLPARKYIVR